MRIRSRTLATPVFLSFLFFAMATSTEAGNFLLRETWDRPSYWRAATQDGTFLPSINPAHGTPNRCLNVGGFGDGPMGTIWHETYRAEYAQGLTIELSAWLASSGWHYTDVMFALIPESADPVTAQPLVQLWLNKGAANDRIVRMSLNLHSPAHQESYSAPPGSYQSNQWERAKIVIRQDQRAEFYVNGNLLWTSTATVDPAFDGHAVFRIQGKESGGPARVDNINIHGESPAEATAEFWSSYK